MKFYAPIFLLIVAVLANSLLCAQEYDGAPVSISSSSLFETTDNPNWPYSITLAETSDGASSQEEQTLDINVTSLPAGAEYRVFKTTVNDPYVSPAQTLSEGSTKITVDAADFDRTVKVQFSSGAITFNALIVNDPPTTISIDDFYLLNTLPNDFPNRNSDLAISVAMNGLALKLGPGTSTLGRDAFGTGSSTFGQTGEWFDGSYLKFGNSGNQQILDLRITNNTGADAKLKNISFDLRRPPTNANYATDFQLLYLDAGDSELIKGSSVADGTEMVNLVGLGSDAISAGINNFSESIGQNISGTAWIADGGYANIRLKLNTTAPQAGSQLDNLVISFEILELFAENSDEENSDAENSDAENSDEENSDGENSDEEVPVEAWYQNVTNLENDWIRSAWLGDFRVRSDPWIYHIEHGWMYIFSNSTYAGGIYFWDDAMKEILWTSKTAYPIQYRFSDKKWIWYLKESKNPRFFVDLATSEWEESE